MMHSVDNVKGEVAKKCLLLWYNTLMFVKIATLRRRYMTNEMYATD